MRKTILICFLCLYCLQAQARVVNVVVGQPASSGCASDTFTIGDSDETGATLSGQGNDYLMLSGYVADVSCTIDEIRVPISSSSVRNLRVAVYADSSNAPTGDDLGQSAATPTQGTGTETLSLTISPAVAITASTKYWIAIWISNATGVQIYHNGDVAGSTYRQAALYSATGDFPTISGAEDWDKQIVTSGYAQ